jgi:catechol 2,3-dioxygenase-like lactoylglutathione lyase family enzyme
MIENIIAKLLSDFERGSMNRRQLIQSLALAAAAVGSGAAYALDATNEKRDANDVGHFKAFKTAELDHISFQVKDYRVTRDFYADLMGMEVLNDDGQRCELRFGNSVLMPRNHRSEAAAAAPQGGGGRGNRPPATALVDHISYRVYNWDTDQVKAELMKRGLLKEDAMPDTGNGIPGYSSFHVFDPDGYDLQISGVAGPNDSVNKKK